MNGDKFREILIEKKYFNEERKIGESNSTIIAIQLDTNTKYIMKILKIKPLIETKELQEQIISFYEGLQKRKYPYFLTPSYISFDENNVPIIISQYKQNKSLKDFLSNPNNEYLLDETQKYILLYKISVFLELFHSDNRIHGDIKLANILVDDENSPYITDPIFFLKNTNNSENEFFEDNSNGISSINNANQLNYSTDIISFAIVIIQVLTNKIINLPYDYQNNGFFLTNEIKPLITNKQIPYDLLNILNLCFSSNIEEHPPVSKIKSIFEKYLNEKINKINSFCSSNDDLNPDIEKIKNRALNGEDKYIYKFGLCRYLGKHCPQNKEEGMNFIRYAANKKKYPPAIQFYEFFRKDYSPYISNSKNNTQIKHLLEDTFFINKYHLDDLEVKIKEYFNNPENYNFDLKKLEKFNFICTKKALERLSILIKYIETGIPVLIEGQTGTSKTVSVEIACYYLGKKLIRFNLSSDTKAANFISNISGNPKKWSGLEVNDGLYLEAYKNGYCILLDEINLAPPEALQFINDTLDSGFISTEIKGNKVNIEKHPNFMIIATQNPNKGSYAFKRKDLPEDFKSRFEIIHFPDFSEEELLKIAEGLASKFDYKNKKIIEKLVKLHIEWSTSEEVKDSIQCFTIRELSNTIKSLSRGEPAFSTIVNIYGSRYEKEMKEKFLRVLSKSEYSCFKASEKLNDFTFTNEDCFINESLLNVIKSIYLSFKYNRHVIIVSKKGNGVSFVARLFAQWYNKYHMPEPSLNNEKFFSCTSDTKNSDFIGKEVPSNHLNSEVNDNNLIEWVDGFLSIAIENGFIAIIDNIDEAQPTILERLNGLLDKSAGEQFSTPENANRASITINKDFHLLCTSKFENFDQMSPAFINRFDVVFLEDQIERKESNIKSLIKKLIINAYKKLNILISDQQTNKDSKIIKIIDLIYSKVDHSSINMSNLSQLCITVTKLDNYFQKIKEKPKNLVDLIVNFSINLLNKNENFEIPKLLKEELLSDLKSPEEQIESADDKFFFKNFEPLKDLMAKLYACSLINLPVCIIGPTGIGKTSLAREFARIRPLNDDSTQFLMQSFSSDTKPKHIFGTPTIKNGKISFNNGTLLTSMIKGFTFIADEFNLSPISTMKAVAPAFEPINGQSIIISGIDEPIKVNPNFFFIACQNELGMVGRNKIPSTIDYKIRFFDYPKQEIEDFSSISVDISKSIYDEEDEKSFTDEDAKKVGIFFYKLNEENIRIIQCLSIRNITKLFHRIYYQDSNKENFIIKYDGMLKDKNIKLIMNLLFYIFSPISKDDEKQIFDQVLDLIIKVFISGSNYSKNDKLIAKQKNELTKLYNDEPIIYKYDNKKCLKKGIFTIYSKSIENIETNIPSLLNGMFQILISDPTEPILLMGPPGMKTFLAQQILKDAEIVTSNQEFTIPQLLGSSAFFSKQEAKLFYIDYICRVCNLDDSKQKYIDLLNQGMLSDKSNKEQFQNKINSFINELPNSLTYSVEHLFEKLFNDDENKYHKCILSNLELEFRPGLFLWAILERKSLILKDLTNLPTTVLERFNELLSGKHNLTLNEDTHDTIVDENHKELTNISKFFRIIATCHPNLISKLSEAVISRFSVIWIPSYDDIEKKIVLKNYINHKKLQFDKEMIIKITDFAEEMQKVFGIVFSFPQIIKSIEMCSRLNKITQEKSKWIDNIAIILFYIGYGLLEQRNKIDDFIHIFEKIDLSLSNDFIKQFKYSNNNNDNNNQIFIDKNPLIITKEPKGVRSENTKIFIESSFAKENEQNLAFTPSFSRMLDALHLGISTNTPVILEGMPGQGKQTAINCLANMLGFNVINIIISKTTKTEDLLGKTTIKRDNDDIMHVELIQTKLVKVLKSIDESQKTIIVFHNLNNASAAVLSILNTMFDQNQKNLLLKDGTIVKMKKIFLVGIFNPQNGIYRRDKLPSSLIYSSIYYIVDNPQEFEILNITAKLFEHTSFQLEIKDFYNNFVKTKSFAETKNVTPLTLNDIVKYKRFREVSYKKFNSNIISLMIFAYRFLDQESIDEVIQNLGLTKLKINPDFTFNSETKNLCIKISKESKEKGILLRMSEDADNPESIQTLKTDILSLTLPEKHCLLFLIFSYLSKQACIIQGPTASGKSFIIRLFAKMLGKKLHVIQLNSETSLSIITGRSVLSNKLSNQDIEKFESYLNKLKEIPELEIFINDEFNDDPSKWDRSNFDNLLNEFYELKLQNEEENKNSNLNEFEPVIQKIQDLMQPAKRFKNKKSIFEKAMKKGEWILLDDIQLAPSEIAEKISSLCEYGDNRELNLNECGENYHFTGKRLPNTNLIHDDFRLFITYNPTSRIEAKQLDPILLNKCAQFTLPPIDSTPESSAQLILGSLIQSYPKEPSLYLSKRIANFHNLMKNTCKDLFAGDHQMTARRLNFIIKEYKNHAFNNKNDPMNDIYKPICNSMYYYYWLSYINQDDKKFKNQMIEEFFKSPNEQQFESLWNDNLVANDKYADLLVFLRNIQYCSKNKGKTNFKFNDFIQKCIHVQVNDVPFILMHITDTIDFISKSDYENNYLNTNLDKEYFQLKIIERIFIDIKDQLKFVQEDYLNLMLEEIYTKIENLDKPISKLILLSKLTSPDIISENPKAYSNDSKYFSCNIPRILFNDEFVHLMEFISKMIESDNIIYPFKMLITQLNMNSDYIPLIESRIPYNLFNRTKFNMINYIMPLIRILHESQTTFHIIVDDKQFDFDYIEQAQFEPFLFFENKNILSISKKSYIENKGKKIIYESENDDPKMINSFFYDTINHFINPDKSIDMKENVDPREKQVPDFSLLLSCNDEISLVAYVWPVLYSFPENNINIFYGFLKKFEQETIQFFNNLYDKFNNSYIDDIFEFTKILLNFGNKQSCLWRIKNETFIIDEKMDLEQEKDKIISEIQDINESLKKIKFDNCEWLVKCTQLLEEQEEKIIKQIKKEQQKKENNEHYNKLESIIDKLESLQIKGENKKSLRTRIINKINSYIVNKKDLKDTIVNQLDKEAQKFIRDLRNFEKNSKGLSNVSTIKNNNIPDILFYEAIIWFSYINDIINNIEESGEETIFQNILQLNEAEETKDIVELLTNRLFIIDNEYNSTSNEVFEIIKSMLNAQLIRRLLKINMIEKMDELDLIFNGLEKREPINEKVIQWIELKVKKYPQDFKLTLPKFKPIDLFFLVNENFEKIPKNLQKTDDYVEFIKEKKMNENSKISISDIQLIARKIDSNIKSGFKFTFNDIGFIQENWLNNEVFINSYPSLVYWLIKNPQNANQIQNIFSKKKDFSKDKLPFGIFALRLLSSENCISFDYSPKSNNKIYIRNTINEIVKNKIKNRISNSKSIGTKWLNILLPTVPVEIGFPKYQMFYQILANISEDDTRLEIKIIKEEKDKMIKQFIQNVCEIVFDETNSYSNILPFIFDPNNLFSSQIDNEIKTIYSEIINSEEYQNLIKYSNNVQEKVNGNLSELKNIIADEINSKNKLYEEKMEEEIKEKKKNIPKYLKNYQNNFDNIQNIKSSEKFKKIQKYFAKLKESQDNIKEIPNIYDNNKKMKLHCFYYGDGEEKSFSDNKKYTCKIDILSDTISKVEEVHLKPKQNYYFSEMQINESIKNELSTKLYGYKLKWSIIDIFALNSKFDIDSYCQKIKEKCTKKVTILFGSGNISQDTFISKFNNSINEAVKSVMSLDKIIHDNRFNNKYLEEIEKCQKQMESTKSDCSVKFSDDSDFDSINDSIENLIKILDSFIDHILIVNKIFDKKKNIIEELYKASPRNNRCTIKAFTPKEFKLPDPNQNNNYYDFNGLFSNVTNKNFFFNPILSVVDGSIKCCFDPLDCVIGPIIPELYNSKRARVNLISFIDDLSMKIEFLNQDDKKKYEHLFSSKRSFSSGELVQIFVSLPHDDIKIDKDLKLEKDINIKTQIHFSSENLKDLILPCNFTFKILPLSILISCDKYKLSFKENVFHLSPKYFMSSTKLKFSIQSPYIGTEEKLNYKYQISSLDKNTSDQLKANLIDENNILEVTIPSTEEIQTLQAQIKIKLTEQFTTSIFIKSTIIPFIFAFDIYNPDSKKFGSNATIFYSSNYFNRDIKLHCRIKSPSFLEKFEGKIDEKVPSNICIKYIGINKNFSIDNDKEFDIILTPKKYTRYYQIEKGDYFIKININGIDQKVCLNFGKIAKETANMYGYSTLNKSWVKIKENEPNECSIFVSPFSFSVIKSAKILYGSKCITENSQSNKIIYINAKGEILEKKSNEFLITKKEGFFKRAFGIFIDFSDSTYYFPIYGKSGNDWYPTFDVYPEIRFNKLAFDDRNIKKAESNKENLTKIEKYGDTNFRHFIQLLYCKDVIMNIEKIIQYLPLEIQNDFKEIVQNVKTIKFYNTKKTIILSNNAIIIFRKYFYDRYQEIKNNRNCISICKLSQNEIDSKVNKCYDEYLTVDENAYNIKSEQYKKISDIKDKVKKIKNAKTLENEQLHDTYLYICKEKFDPIPIKSNFKYKPRSLNSTNNFNNNLNNIQINLPEKEYVKEDSFQTISNLKSFYDSYIEGIRLLPIFVYVMKLKNDSKMKTQAVKYFEKLYQIYTNLPDQDYSIISPTTNLFMKTFATMIGKFKKAGIDIDKILGKKISLPNDSFQSFIELPERDIINPLPQVEWINNNKNSSKKEIDFYSVDSSNLASKYKNDKKDKPTTISNVQTNNDNSVNKNLNTRKGENESKEKDFQNMVFELNNNIKKNANSNQNSNARIPTSYSKPEISSQVENETALYIPDYSKPLPSFIQHSMLSTSGGELGIKRALDRINKMDKEKYIFEIYDNIEPHKIINNDLIDIEKTQLPINELIKHGLYFANLFINAASEIDIPRSKFAVNILVDCSSLINDTIKMFHMVIICGLTQALNSLSIKYSVAVIADMNFRCIIKEFDDPHSPIYLQKICDCLFIKRYRTKLASSVKFAIDKMSYINDERPYRAIFTFSDGLDEQLLLPSKWLKYIQKNENLSYGFVFSISPSLSNIDVDKIKKMWYNFECEINTSYNIKISSINIKNNENNGLDIVDISTKMIELFTKIMQRETNKKENKLKVNQFENATFCVDKLTDISRITSFLNINFNNLNEIYANSKSLLYSRSTIIDKLNTKVYQNILKKILKCDKNPDVNTDELIKKLLINRNDIDLISLETIFKPNKASQLILSTTGTEFDIIALVLNLLNPVPEPMIYLEEKGGWIRNYAVSIVIDPSLSCFDDLSGPHSMQTIKNILSSLSILDISCFDLIIAGNPNPKIICSDIGTIYALSNKSSLYDSMFAALQKPISNPDLGSAIHTAFDIGRLRSSEYTSFLFVLTNGMYNSDEREKIIDSVNMCVQNGIATFGIGIGLYPKGIENLFPQVVYAKNPSNVMKAISSFYGDQIPYLSKEMTSIDLVIDVNNLFKTIDMLIDKEKNPVFKQLKDELKGITPLLDAFDDIYNHEKKKYNAKTDSFENLDSNPEYDVSTQMYVSNILKDQQILIVMLWDCTLNPKHEESFVHQDYISRPSKDGIGCILSAVKVYGISLKIVQNYKDAIEELTKQSKPGYCDYYATWVFCGPPYKLLPEKNKDPNYIGQFIEVLIKFWKNGGSIVFWADGEPLNYQVNLFLEQVEFIGEDDLPDGKTKLRIHGDHKGEQILLPDETGKLDKNSTFNRSPNIFDQCQRPMISNNIWKIFEGISIGYADPEVPIAPFRPFARDSEGGISSLFYPANLKEGTGDIIIDCGYTKCFTQMEKDGTFIYVQNIAGWTGRPEVHIAIDNIQPSEWRPKAVKHYIRYEIWKGFKELSINPKELKTIWAIDSSDSINGCIFFHSELSKIINEYPIKNEDEIYFWDDDKKKVTVDELNSFISNKGGVSKGQTKSHLIAEIAEKSQIREHLIIVTDGDVGHDEIDESDKLMTKNNIRFKFVTIFIILKEFSDSVLKRKKENPDFNIEPHRINYELSVGAPYCRGCPNVTYLIKKEDTREKLTTLSTSDIQAFEEMDYISDYETFIEQYKNLENAFQAMSLGQTKNENLIKKLEELFNRMKANNQINDDFTEKYNNLHHMASGCLYDAFTIEKIHAALIKK